MPNSALLDARYTRNCRLARYIASKDQFLIYLERYNASA